jgi:hypothetical protein
MMAISLTAFAYQKAAKHFGEPFTDAKAVVLKDVIADVDKYSGKAVKVEGKVEGVCQERGCWLVVRDGKSEMRVTFKDYSFFVPKDSAGKRVTLEGLVVKKTITEDHARHYAEESGGKVDPLTIKGPQEVITMVAAGVSIQD